MKITRFDRSRIRRGGFTLIELMIVITIIIALMALTASAIFKLLGTQQSANTQSFLDRTQSQLGKAWGTVSRQAHGEVIPTAIASSIQTSLAGTDANATGRVRAIYVKLKQRQTFPMNFDEALNLATPRTGNLQSPVPALPAYVNYLTSLGITGSTGDPRESSACLLMALQRGVSGAGINPSDLTSGGATGSYMTPNGGNLPYLTDAWGRPIFFTRVPTGCPVLNPNGSQPGINDPSDPQGYLQTPNWGTTFGPTFQSLTLQSLAKGNTSFRLAPMLASGGPDNWQKPGGTLPFDPITFAPTTGGGAIFSNP
jgi:type II secretory pathway pseudopilin PulG